MSPRPSPPPQARADSSRAGLLRAFWELLHDLAVAVLFCFFLVTFVGQAFRVQGTSMLPLLEDGERIIVNKLVYRFRPIGRGDVVVFWYPRDPSVSFIKRVVGLPGDVVELREGYLFVNGKAVEEGYLNPRFRDEESYAPVEVKKGYYYVLGRPSKQQQRQPELGRSAREVHLRPGRGPLLAARQDRSDSVRRGLVAVVLLVGACAREATVPAHAGPAPAPKATPAPVVSGRVHPRRPSPRAEPTSAQRHGCCSGWSPAGEASPCPTLSTPRWWTSTAAGCRSGWIPIATTTSPD